MKVVTNREDGTDFLGCSSWPKTKCDFTLSLLEENSEGEDGRRAFSVLSEDEYHGKLPQPTQRGRLSKATAALIGWLHKWHRRRLESDEPDATGVWESKHRRSVLRYVYNRDGGKCGLCGAKTKIKGAQVEHIAPKVFTTFNINGGKAVSGNQFKSVLHKLDNLQAAHSYCNKPKGNTPELRKWRHPDMPPLGIALTPTGSRLMVPAPGQHDILNDGTIATKKATQRGALALTAFTLWSLGSVLAFKWWYGPAGEEVQAALTEWLQQLVGG